MRSRLDPNSIYGRAEWSLRSSLSFLLSGLMAVYFRDFIAIPFLLPILVLVVSNNNFGATMKISQSMYRGTMLVTILASVAYFIPFIHAQYWYLALSYFFLTSLFLTVTLSHDAAARKLSLAFHVIFTLNITYRESTNYSISQIWLSWMLVPMTIIISAIGVLIPWPIFAYQQLLFAEEKSVKTIKNWLNDIILFFQCTDKIDAKIQRAKLRKYHQLMIKNRAHLSSLYPIAKNYEMIHKSDKLLDEERLTQLQTVQYILLAMVDAIGSLSYDKFHFQMLNEIKDSLQNMTDFLIKCLDHCIANKEQIRCSLIKHNNELLDAYKKARHKLLFNKSKPNIHSVNIHHSFIYFFQSLGERLVQYSELRSDYVTNKKQSRFSPLFCHISLYNILYPFPFVSWKDFGKKLSPFIHWKSEIFLQALAISITMTVCSLLFIYPPLHDIYQLGFWASLTVAFVSDSNTGGTFFTSLLRLEGTFLGVCAGYIILQLRKHGMSQLSGIMLLTVWNMICGYFQSHPTRGYSALVASFTAALLVIGYHEAKGFDIQYYAIRRIEMTFIGIAAILLILQIFSPNNARKLLDKEMTESMRLMKQMFEELFNRYRTMIDCTLRTESDEIDEGSEEKCDMNLLQRELVFAMRESPNELKRNFMKRKSRVTQLLDSQKLLINASVFEPSLFWNDAFNEELYFKLNHIQFWILRRVSQIDLCLRTLLVYVERHNESHWMLNRNLIIDIVPFTNYMESFERCHDIIISSMQSFIKKLGTTDSAKLRKNNKVGNRESNEDIMKELEKVIASQWIEFENMLFEYLEKNNLTNGKRKSQIISTKGALTMQALRFATNNLLSALSDFAECKLSY